MSAQSRLYSMAAVRGKPTELEWDAERDNLTVVKTLCAILDRLQPKPEGSYVDQISFVADRPGHDVRYAINASKIKSELGWRPTVSFDQGIEDTVAWYLANQEWCREIHENTYQRQRLGSIDTKDFLLHQ